MFRGQDIFRAEQYSDGCLVLGTSAAHTPIFATCVLVLLSCNRIVRDHDPFEFPIDSIQVATGFPIIPRHSGVLVDHDGEEHLYFADPVTYKRIMFFDPDGEIERTIALDAALDSIGGIDGVSVSSMNSIFLSSTKGRSLVEMDSLGHCSRVIQLAPLLRTSNGDLYELGSSTVTGFLMDSICYFRSYWISNEVDDSLGVAPMISPTWDYLQYFHDRDRWSHYIASVDLRGEPKLTFSMDSFYYDLDHEPAGNNEPSHYVCSGDHVIAFSDHSNELFVLDRRTNEIDRKITVFSEYGPVSSHAVRISELSSMEDYGAWIKAKRDSARMFFIGYDRRHARYLVAIQHKNSRTMDLEDSPLPPISIVFYNDDFKREAEYPLFGAKYQIAWSLSTTSGLLVMRAENKRERMSGIHVFHLFDLHEE